MPPARAQPVPSGGGGRPRLLAVMGSGETAPTMAKVHRDLIDRLGTPPNVPAVMLDTPFGFQENADVITAKALAYFAESVQRPMGVASLRSAGDGDAAATEQALLRLRSAAYVFAGPGSPSYALRQWEGSRVPGLLAGKLRDGGCITFASAAAVTLGRLSLPVYEIYKVGEPVRWLDGLDLLAAIGLDAVVVPHFNNAEGGNHDTRYCYMGERRLSMLEDLLPDDMFILGVDEHTAFILDLDAGTATVAGIGRVTVRRHGDMTTMGPGDTTPLAELVAGPGPASEAASGTGAGSEPGRVAATELPGSSPGPLLEAVAGCEQRFEAALSGGDAAGATSAVLDLETTLTAWEGDTTQSDHADQGRAALRSLVVRLGDAATNGLHDPAQSIAPFVDALLAAREKARQERRWADADELRDQLVQAGVEIQDTPDGTKWSLS